MQDLEDLALLREYAVNDSETAFEELVSRRISFVYSAALRQVRDVHLAEEITQAVFIILAQKSGRISGKTILTGWLFKTTRFAALSQIRADAKRARQEKEFQMQNEFQSTATDEIWNQMSPLLDEALAALGEKDRQAVLLRFFENKSLAEVGNNLGTGEDTARKRVSRALEKLHRYFQKRGVSSTTAIIAGTISANSVQAAPVALAKTATAVALAKGATASISTLTLIKGALKIMAWTKAKTAIVAGVVILLALGITAVTTVSIKKYKAHEVALNSWRLGNLYFHPEALSNALPQVRILPTKFKAPIYGGTYVPPNRFAMVRAPVVDVVSIAYGCSRGRIFFSDGEPKERYDFVATLPHGNAKALQQEIKKTLGLVAHKETRDTDVLVLKVRNPNSSGLKPYDEQGTPRSFYDIRGHIICTGQPMASLADRMEIFLRVPVIDETGLSGNYNLDLKWNEDSHQNSNHDLLKQALTDQLGLELVPTNMPIEMLVVEKSN